MGIITEEFERNNVKYVKRYSDKKVFIERNGEQYVEAVDPIEYKDSRIYTETDKPIEVEQEGE